MSGFDVVIVSTLDGLKIFGTALNFDKDALRNTVLAKSEQWDLLSCALVIVIVTIIPKVTY